MNWIQVDSSVIKKVAYENGILYAVFASGSCYSYHGVENYVFDVFISANSIGRFFVTNIRDSYPYKRIY